MSSACCTSSASGLPQVCAVTAQVWRLQIGITCQGMQQITEVIQNIGAVCPKAVVNRCYLAKLRWLSLVHLPMWYPFYAAHPGIELQQYC